MSTFRVATWNLQRPAGKHGPRQDRLRRWLEEVEADVWILTETHRELKPGAGYEGYWTEATDRAQTEGEAWVAIWSRFPIREVEPTRDDARAIAALVEVPGAGEVVVYGSVLPWLGSEWRGVRAAGGDAFRAALGAQQADWRDLRRLHPKANVLVAGDFNQDLASAHYYGSKRNRRDLQDALRSAALECLTGGEGDPVWVQTNGARASIDHLCVGAGLRRRLTGSLRCWPAGTDVDPRLSDHFGVSADFALEDVGWATDGALTDD